MSQELEELIESKAIFIINSDEDVVRLCNLLKVESLDKASALYHKLTGKEVLDHRDSSEYTNVNAQCDPDFWSEEPIADIYYNQTL